MFVKIKTEVKNFPLSGRLKPEICLGLNYA